MPDAELGDLVAGARALLFPGAEDFGTSRSRPAAGVPVIAWGVAGVRDSVIDGETGIFFEHQTADALADAILAFEAMDFDEATIRETTPAASRPSVSASRSRPSCARSPYHQPVEHTDDAAHRRPRLEDGADDDCATSPFELFRVIWRRRLLVVLVVILSMLASVLLVVRTPKEYSSSASLLFRDPGFARTLYGNDLFDAGQDPKRATQTKPRRRALDQRRGTGQEAAGHR